MSPGVLGLMFLVRKHPQVVVHKIDLAEDEKDLVNNVLIVEVKNGGTCYTYMTVYVPGKWTTTAKVPRTSVMTGILQVVARLTGVGKQIIMGGDFNCSSDEIIQMIQDWELGMKIQLVPFARHKDADRDPVTFSRKRAKSAMGATSTILCRGVTRSRCKWGAGNSTQ